MSLRCSAFRVAGLLLCSLCLLTAGSRSGHAQSRPRFALVVGIDYYPRLRSHPLRGSAADAREVASLLRRAGYRVTLLTNRQATKRRVLGELKGGSETTGSFVFYFSGHGSNNAEGDRGALLCADALPDSGRNDLRRGELAAALSRIGAPHRVVLLEAQQSGAILPDTPSGGGGHVCYLTASRTEEVTVRRADRRGGGHFTQRLAHEARASLKQGRALSLGDLQARITATIRRGYTQQHPSLSKGCAEHPLFPGRPGASAPPVTRARPAPEEPAATPQLSVWNEFHRDYPNPGRLSLSMAPNRAAVAAGSTVLFTLTTRRSGHLLVLMRDTDGKIRRIFPADERLSTARVRSEQRVSLPPHRFAKPGALRVKAFYFGRTAQAAAWMKAVGPEGERSVGTDVLRQLRAPQWTAFSADAAFEVTDARAP